MNITQLRNIKQAQLEFSPTINFLIGGNGAGKTSILEALHLIGLGRSFRSHLKSRLIQHGQQSFTLFAELMNDQKKCSAAIEKSLKGESKLRLNGQDIDSITEFARLLPLQLLNPDSYQLIDSGPKYRRQFIDWGVFHVEHTYLQLWNKSQRLLKQRNAAIRQGCSNKDIQCWDHTFIHIAEQINAMRQQYFDAFQSVFTQLTTTTPIIHDISLRYYPGWNQQQGLAEQLKQRLSQDCHIGYTVNGPQRADLRIHYHSAPAQDILSRGQQKLLVCILRLAQATLFRQQTDRDCIFLVDDLPSELDKNHRDIILQQLYQQNGQCFITSIENQSIPLPTDKAQKTLFLDF